MIKFKTRNLYGLVSTNGGLEQKFQKLQYTGIFIIYLKDQGKAYMVPLIRTVLSCLIINEPCCSMQIITEVQYVQYCLSALL